MSINASGQVAGYSYITNNQTYHATLWNDTIATDLGTLDGTYSLAYSINASGQVVGTAETTSNYLSYSAVLWSNGSIFDLNSFLDADTVNQGWILYEARSINDNGWIAGTAYNSITGAYHAFVLQAVPEPETYAMLIVGLGLIGFVARRKRA